MSTAIGARVWTQGRTAWILALIVGLAGIVVGVAIGAAKTWAWNHGVAGWLVGVGAAFSVVGLIFLILSYATRGQSD
jgi:vacuolar-type H+-ATPase subunit I/STV1